MASSTLPDMDDEMDEDFFDRLIKDDDDYGNVCVASAPSIVKEDDSDDAKVISNLTISETGPSGIDFDVKEGFKVNDEQGCDSADVLASVDIHENNVVNKEQNSAANSDVNDASEVSLRQDVGLESKMSGESSTYSGTCVKEVHWASFNSDIHSHSGDKVKSFSDFFGEVGDDTDDPFANVEAMDNSGSELNTNNEVTGKFVNDFGSSSCGQYSVGNEYLGAESEQNAGGHDLTGSQDWENHYPGWKYDPITGQWHQLDGHNANMPGNANGYVQESIDVSAQSGNVVSEQSASAYYSHHTSQSVTGSVGTGLFTTDGVSNWKQISQGNEQYPAHMVFDPQYPGWYYDMIAQEWRSSESYAPVVNQSTSSGYNQPYQNKSFENSESQMHHSREYISNLAVTSSEEQGLKNQYGATGILDSSNEQTGSEIYGSTSSQKQANQNFDNGNGNAGFHSFNSSEQFPQHHNQTKVEPSQNMQFSPAYFDSQKAIAFSQQPFLSDTQFSYVPSEGRSSVGRPPHALVTFGFGGKLIVTKRGSSFHSNSPYENKDSGGVFNVLNLTEVVLDKADASNFELGYHDYFVALCQQPLPGPLVGGNVGNKELNQWIDDRISNCDMNYRNGEVLRLLFSLLKISCQYYGKLRSPLGTDQGSKENDCPESAVAKLFASAKRSGMQSGEYGAFMHCVQNLPSEAEIQATAVEVQKLLISGRKKEALECAQEGQLWGPALVIATDLGDQFYGDTVKNMALKQFVAGSPLQTLCLLMAGNPADLFSNVATRVGLHGYLGAPQQALQRTELYEYSKVLGNSQFLLHSFQPYKLIYAHMLAEVGKVAESLKYCQAILKSLKTGREPEVETWRQLASALEERLRIHQQGGYSTNLAPKKLVGKLLTFFDSSPSRVVDSLPPPVPSTSHGSVKRNEYAQQPEVSKVSNSQSTMDVSSVMPSASMGPISERTGDSTRATISNRSILEPDFGRTPGKADSSKGANSSDTQLKASAPVGSSRFGRFGSQIFQKTVGLVLRSQPHQQAKLGEKNRFYYDEKLKRWVEEGAEPPAEEVALPPPPSTTAFQGTVPYDNIKDTPKVESHSNGVPEYFSPISSEKGSGIPPIPPSSNQFSARGRSGVRSRYVDTFNKGGVTPATSFQSPSFPAKISQASNPKFFIPTPVASSEDIVQTTAGSTPEVIADNENPPIYTQEDSLSSPPTSTPTPTSPPSISMHRFPSMDNVVQKKSTGMLDDNNSLPHS
ncbi:protein transport protein SEC16B homolog isoform X2 [Tripterygium wilfordii]|uniref:protein transport protein SEC16B homolog isoform X2 n=1 Tax=Tripterygium wilfordii TaxID=458696 RepID=UPI0018F8526D|nr:protein transport protein SEC16B homolog isoform X2 [Tripterygium wilfordii]